MSDQLDANGAWEKLYERASEYCEINYVDIYVDDSLQRALNPAQVVKIKDNYNPHGFGRILVAGIIGSENPDKKAVIDGQTRYSAWGEIKKDIELRGKPTPRGFGGDIVPVEVFSEVTREEAALLFRLRNNQKPVLPRDRDRLFLVEGDPLMREVVKQSLDAGYVVFSDDDGEVTMTGLADAKKVTRWGTKHSLPGLLTRSLTVQRQAFTTPEGGLLGTVDPKVLSATARLIINNPDINEDELIRVMAGVGLPALVASATAAARTAGTRLEGALRTIIAERYNIKKRKVDQIKR